MSFAQAQRTTEEFRLPEVPVLLTDPAERAAYLAVHYWDYFNFADTTLISRPEITEQAFVDFLGGESGAKISHLFETTKSFRKIFSEIFRTFFLIVSNRISYSKRVQR